LRGETGTGKELAARTFHSYGPHAKGPLVAVNCAAIPEGLAERLLFGAKKGAYSGAAEDAVGHIAAADGGVLFLDEVGELDLNVQAKLLRALETREVVPLGATSGKRVSVRVCVAPHRDLRAHVATGQVRADLYHRLAPPEVVLPALRERLDEIARHVVAEVATRGLTAHARLVEACLLRPWPGNVRELRKEIRHATARALADAEQRVRLEHMSEAAGRSFELDDTLPEQDSSPTPAAQEPPKRRSYIRWSQSMTRERIQQALADCSGNVAHAAKSLGMHRTQLYREMARFALQPRAARG
jgi:transcriptional regulator with GAF, ATPase, and Fis domain